MGNRSGGLALPAHGSLPPLQRSAALSLLTSSPTPGHSPFAAVGSCKQPAVTDKGRPAEEVGEVEQPSLPGLRVGATFLGPDGSGVCPALPWGEDGRQKGYRRARWEGSGRDSGQRA